MARRWGKKVGTMMHHLQQAGMYIEEAPPPSHPEPRAKKQFGRLLDGSCLAFRKMFLALLSGKVHVPTFSSSVE